MREKNPSTDSTAMRALLVRLDFAGLEVLADFGILIGAASTAVVFSGTTTPTNITIAIFLGTHRFIAKQRPSVIADKRMLLGDTARATPSEGDF
jgi:hypothetical protein